MDDWSDNCDVVGLCGELSTRNGHCDRTSSLNLSCPKLRPKTSRSGTRGTVLHRDQRLLSRKPGNGLRSIPPSSRQTLPCPGQVLYQTRKTSSLPAQCNACSARQFRQKQPC